MCTCRKRARLRAAHEASPAAALDIRAETVHTQQTCGQVRDTPCAAAAIATATAMCKRHHIRSQTSRVRPDVTCALDADRTRLGQCCTKASGCTHQAGGGSQEQRQEDRRKVSAHGHGAPVASAHMQSARGVRTPIAPERGQHCAVPRLCSVRHNTRQSIFRRCPRHAEVEVAVRAHARISLAASQAVT